MTTEHAPRRKAKAIAIARTDVANHTRFVVLATGLAASLSGLILWLVRF